MSEAFWIDKKGVVVDAGRNHISTIFSDPKRFGITKEHIVKTYAKYGERMLIEGRSRREIIDDTIELGWIRLRRYKNSRWSITINKLDKHTRKLITDWAKRITTTGIFGIKETDMYLPIKFVALRSRQSNQDYTVGSVVKGVLLDGKKIVETSEFLKIFAKKLQERY